MEYLKFFLKEFIGRKPNEMAILSKYNFENYLWKIIYPQDVKEIDFLKALGIPIVLLSGSINVIVFPID